MRIGILGTGQVGRTLGTKLVAVGHEVRLGGREAANDASVAWAEANGPRASTGTFSGAASFGEMLFNCTGGAVSLDALRLAGEENLDGKLLVDVANPLDFSKGFPPTLTVCNDDSLGERIQRTFPGLRVVKALNTVNCALMVDPGRIAGDHDLFICGNDPDAKATVSALLRDAFGWTTIHDLGDIANARGTEAWLLLWVRLMRAQGTADFNIRVVR